MPAGLGWLSTIASNDERVTLIEQLSLADIASRLKATLIGNDVMFSQLSTDTRTLQPGAVHLALKGERFDGHQFANVAEESGAAGLVVERQLDSPLPQLVVDDTLVALGDIARINRQKSNAVVIALTGSQGKTTVKEMAASILSSKGSTLATHANLNNTIGVPLTLLQLNPEHQFAVIEMGANSAGEIAFSVSVAEPDIALITNANAAHVEGFGSLDGIVEAKGEILDALDSQGVAVLNADDPNVDRWLDRASQSRRLTFSAAGKEDADVRAENIQVNANGQVSFKLQSQIGEVEIDLSLVGGHNVSNALAASSVAIAAGATLDHVRQGLQSVNPVPGRLVRSSGAGGSLLIDDTYNASPASFFAAIDVLAQHPGRKILLAGDMKELGDEAQQSHAAVGRYAAEKGIDELLVVGEFAAVVAEAFGSSARQFDSKEEMIASALECAGTDIVYLVKGSRGAHMETVVEKLRVGGEG